MKVMLIPVKTQRCNGLMCLLMLFVMVLLTPTAVSGADTGNPPAKFADKIPLYIGGIFPFSDTDVFLGSFPRTVLAAIEHVNNMTGLLDGYELKMTWSWTYIQPHLGLRLLHDMTYQGEQIIMLWGPALSKTATVVNEVAPTYNLLQFCLASSSALKDRTRFPLTVQLYYDELTLNEGMVAFVKEMGWQRVAIMYDDIEFFHGTFKHLAGISAAQDLKILSIEAVSDIEQIDRHLESILQHDARIIFTGFYHDDGIKLFCSAYKKGMYGSKYVWFRPGWYLTGWWTDELVYNAGLECTPDQVEEVLKYQMAFVGNQPVDDVNLVDFAGLKPHKEQREYLTTMLRTPDPAGAYRFFAYDILMYMALTLNMSIEPLTHLNPPKRLEDFTYEDSEMTRVMLKNAHRVDFDGMTGRMATGKDSVRYTQVYIQQDRGGWNDNIMTYESQRGQLSYLTNMSFYWHGSKPPVDGITEQFVPVQILHIPKIILFIIAGIGVALAVVFLIINIAFRDRKAIKVSCPPLNTVIAIGSVFLYSTVFILGANISSTSDSSIVILCHLQTTLVAVGFSLVFGGLFMKTYRIHAIFYKAVQKLKRINLPDWKLLMAVFLFVLIDAIIMTLWIGIGNVHVDETHLEPKLDETQPDNEIYIVPTIKFCTSKYQLYFSLCLYAIKGILLVFGIFLAWETRNVAIAALNDSKYIAMSVYTVAITLSITIPMLLVLGDTDLQFIVSSTAILVANTAVLLLVFIPKIYIFLTKDESEIRFTTLHTDTSGNISSGASTAEENVNRLIKKLTEKQLQLKVLQSEHIGITNTLKPPQKTEDWIQATMQPIDENGADEFS